MNGLTFQNITFGFTVGGVASADSRFNSVALGTAGPRFAIDNLNTTVVPEPGTVLFGALIASVCATARTRRR